MISFDAYFVSMGVGTTNYTHGLENFWNSGYLKSLLSADFVLYV